MDRREFLRWLAQMGSATAVGGLVACRSDEQPDEQPVESPAKPSEQSGDTDDERQPSRVAIVATSERAAGVHRAADLLDHDFRNQEIFIKPNFNSADPPPGSTHNAVLEALVRHCQSHRGSRIVVGDRSGMADTREVMRQKQIFAMSHELGFEAVVFDELSAEQWERIEHPDHHWQQGFALPRPVLAADAYVQTCCLKTHRFGGHFTMALKNNVGLAARTLPGDPYNFMSELHDADAQRVMIAEINDALTHDLIVLDAVEGFYERGPEAGPVAEFNAIIAGADPVAIDALGVALLRRHGTTPEVESGPIAELEQIARAIELEVGTADPDWIEVVTPDQSSQDLADELMAELG